MLIVRWRPHLREPHESAERGEQRPDTNGAAGLVTQEVLERVGLEIKLKQRVKIVLRGFRGLHMEN